MVSQSIQRGESEKNLAWGLKWGKTKLRANILDKEEVGDWDQLHSGESQICNG